MLTLEGKPTIRVQTKNCFVCGKFSVINVDSEAIKQYVGGAFVQDAFPFATADERELLMTGIHPSCWETITGGEE
jgi:hypothetical protein